MSETSGSKPDQGTEKKKLSTQKKQKYAYIPDNFSTLEQVSLSLSLLQKQKLISCFFGFISFSEIGIKQITEEDLFNKFT